MAAATYSRDLTGRNTVAGLFEDRAHAQQAISDLKAAGFTDEQIGVALRDRDEQGQLMADTGTHAAADAGKGAVGGGILGGLVGLLVGVGALAIPGIGPVVAGGIFAHALGATAVGAGIGAVGGGIIGALTGLGIPEHEARHFETGFNAGGTLVTVKAEGRAPEAIDILERDGGDTGASAYSDYGTDTAAVGTVGAASPYAGEGDYARTTAATGYTDTPTGTTDYATANPGDQRVELHEEVLNAQTQPVQTGEVTLRKEVVTETRSIDVPVTREEVVIERHAVSGGQVASNADFNSAEEVIRVPVMEEQVTVTKTPIVTEEISIGKRQVQEVQHVQDTVRREEAYVDNPGNADVLERGAVTNSGVIGSEVDEDEVDTPIRSTTR